MHRGDEEKGSAYRPSLRCPAVSQVRHGNLCFASALVLPTAQEVPLPTSMFVTGLAERLTRMVCQQQEVVRAPDVCGMAHSAALLALH